MVKRLAAKCTSTEGMSPSQIVRTNWALELEAAGKAVEGNMLLNLVGRDAESADAIIQSNETNARKFFANLNSPSDSEHASRLNELLYSESTLAPGNKPLDAPIDGDPIMGWPPLHATESDPSSEIDPMARSRQPEETNRSTHLEDDPANHNIGKENLREPWKASNKDTWPFRLRPFRTNSIKLKRMNAWMRYLGKKNVEFEIGTELANAVLNKFNSEGLFVSNYPSLGVHTIYLMASPATSAFMEESYHALQYLGKFKEKMTVLVDDLEGNISDRIIDAWEYHAKIRILRENKKYKQYLKKGIKGKYSILSAEEEEALWKDIADVIALKYNPSKW